jgi:hypothetical protein
MMGVGPKGDAEEGTADDVDGEGRKEEGEQPK